METDTDIDSTPALRRGLDGYIGAVADELEVPAESMSFEISDTATAYLGLSTRWPSWPGHDLMLIWDERAGWSIAVETTPAERAVVIARLGGEPVPSPRVVSRWVETTLAGSRPQTAPHQTTTTQTAPPHTTARAVDRHALAVRLSAYVSD
ncbi:MULTISPECIES: DUF6292 family protein [Prauserella salsuginis group]|uniref:DUF6292 domain-containing protein n=2 Tax=Prauserella salsuginis group TaxID=2893672 RepID=A0A839XQ69_9PSEU|nr:MULTISPECIES: DUF6292 family protein [Prauserella salsuginis group]MBB3663634.1 hypothetical protein [Prauserella sediminis]MCR3722584.1 hypothetical protein [Prauserella flava]MCR3737026.1 hypothetical protein [Prauserella salsuginis]